LIAEIKDESRKQIAFGIIKFFWFSLAMFAIGSIILLTGIVEPIVYGWYFIIFSGITAIAFPIFGRIF